MDPDKKPTKGVSVDAEQEQRRGGPTDPEGNVSSGLQPGPLRTKGGRPVADSDEATGPSTHDRDMAEHNVTQAELDAAVERKHRAESRE